MRTHYKDVPDDMRRLNEMPQQVSSDCDSSYAVALDCDVMLRAEEVRLQPCLDHVEWAGHYRAAHPSQPAQASTC